MTTSLFAKADTPPGFNHVLAEKAARQVFEHWHDPEYRHGLVMAFGSIVSDLLFEHQGEIQEMLDIAAARESAKLKRAIAKAYVKTAYGEVIYKAGRNDPDEEKKHPHGAGGRFINSNWRPNININWQGREPMGDAARAQQTARIANVLGHAPGSVPHGEFSVGGQVMDIAHALGANENQAGSAGAIAAHLHHQLVTNGTYDPKTGEYRAGQELKKTWHTRLVDASHALFHLFGGNRGRGAYLVGKFVGTHGQAAVNALGPRFRRFFYRYKGSEVPITVPDRANDNRGNPISVEAYEKALALHLAKKNGQNAIPDQATAELALNSGRTVPSQGWILNKDGKVVSQAVGFGDDHYLPFNLKKLPNMEGGSYVRSRTWGGPTTEDVHLAIVSGAKRATVASRFGTYTIHFQGKANKGLARYGTVQRAIVNRYGRLLDAVKAGKINLVGEAGGTTGQESGLTAEGYRVALDALKHQFPQYIKSVEYHPWGQTEGINRSVAKEVDRAYVRPGAVQPYHAIVNGLFDNELDDTDPRRNLIRGTGQSAGKTNAPVMNVSDHLGVATSTDFFGGLSREERELVLKDFEGKDWKDLSIDDRAMLNRIYARGANKNGMPGQPMAFRKELHTHIARERAGASRSQQQGASYVAEDQKREADRRAADMVASAVVDQIDAEGDWHGDIGEDKLPLSEINGEPSPLWGLVKDIRAQTENGRDNSKLADIHQKLADHLYQNPEARRNLADAMIEDPTAQVDESDRPLMYGADWHAHAVRRGYMDPETGVDHPGLIEEEGWGREKPGDEDAADKAALERTKKAMHPEVRKAYNILLDHSRKRPSSQRREDRAEAARIESKPANQATVREMEWLSDYNTNKDETERLAAEYERLRKIHHPNGLTVPDEGDDQRMGF